MKIGFATKDSHGKDFSNLPEQEKWPTSLLHYCRVSAHEQHSCRLMVPVRHEAGGHHEGTSSPKSFLPARATCCLSPVQSTLDNDQCCCSDTSRIHALLRRNCVEKSEQVDRTPESLGIGRASMIREEEMRQGSHEEAGMTMLTTDTINCVAAV